MEASPRGRGQLLCGLVILVALAAVLATTPGGAGSRLAEDEESAPAPAVADTALAPRSLTKLALRAEARVARRVEALRGLEFDGVPEPEVVDSAYLNALSARESLKTKAYGALAADEVALRILGVMDPYEQLDSIFGSTGDVAAAAYDPRSDRLYIVADAVAPNRALVEFVLAHELTHALEDQRYGLGGGVQLDDDAALALGALNEGSATSLMTDYAGEHLNPIDLLGATAGLDSETGLPEFYEDLLMWEYLGGARFVGELRQLAGSWKLVDYALRSRPPASTEQLLHVEKYLQAEAPLPAAIESDVLREDGWQRAGGGVVGELSTRQMLAAEIDHSVAREAAAGWGGDAYGIWQRATSPAQCEAVCRNRFVVAVDWRTDTPADAQQLARAVTTYIDQGLLGKPNGKGGWYVTDGAAAVRAEGEEVALVFAPSALTASAVAEEQLAP